MSLWEELDIPAKWIEMDIHDKMAHLAEMQTHLPYDLIRDVWDVADGSRISHETFEMLLNQAIGTLLDKYESIEAYCAERTERY